MDYRLFSYRMISSPGLLAFPKLKKPVFPTVCPQLAGRREENKPFPRILARNKYWQLCPGFELGLLILFLALITLNASIITRMYHLSLIIIIHLLSLVIIMYHLFFYIIIYLLSLIIIMYHLLLIIIMYHCHSLSLFIDYPSLIFCIICHSSSSLLLLLLLLLLLSFMWAFLVGKIVM